MNVAEIRNDLFRQLLEIEDQDVLKRLMVYLQSLKIKQKKAVDLSKYRGAFKSGLSLEALDQKLDELHNEWERNIY